MRLALYVHAACTAHPRQLRARALAPLRRRRFPRRPLPAFMPLTRPLDLWRSPAFEPAVLAGEGAERLRAFHLHYGDDVLAAARSGDAAATLAAARRWIASNPTAPDDAWHPYTTSTRAGNWIAAASLLPGLATPDVVASLWRQLLRVAATVEDEILGNHVIRNARALVLGGVAFGDAALLERGRGLLARELPEQVLPDGGHYERSPVYHLVVLRDLLEIEAADPGLVPAQVLEQMRRWAATLARPDGRPALFNDGGLDLAPVLDLPHAADGLILLEESGFAVIRREPLWLAFRCGVSGPAFLPPHAHADALSLQLWWAGRPIVIDPGTSTYEPGADRRRERGTAAHATVALDGRDQFELWGAFRSGPFPDVELLEAGEDRLCAQVAWRGGIVHRRTIEIAADAVNVLDDIDGHGSHQLVTSLPLGGRHDGIEAVGPLPVADEESWAAERFFERVRRPVLAQRGTLMLPARIGWRIPLR